MRMKLAWMLSLAVVGLVRVAGAQTTSGFVAIVPCRLVDTRLGSTQGYPAPYGAPGLVGGQKRVLHVGGPIAPLNPCANQIPASDVTAVDLNITAVQAQAEGFLIVAPGNPLTMPKTSILNFTAGPQALGNSTTVGVLGGTIALQSTQPVQIIVDVMGYYTTVGRSGSPVVRGSNQAGGDGVQGLTNATGSGGAGVSGHGDSGGYGVYGQSSTNHGVHGKSSSGDGVYGTSAGGQINAAGVKGIGTGQAYGVYGSSSNSAGVRGFGVTGVQGVTIGAGPGVDGQNAGNGSGVNGYSTSGVGVRGASQNGVGVLAEGNGAGGTALEVRNGGLRMTGNSLFAFAVDTTKPGSYCKDSHGNHMAVVESPLTNAHPEALLFVTPGSGFTSNDEDGHFAPWYYSAAGGSCPSRHWFVLQTNGDLDAGVIVNVLVISR